MIWHQTGIPWEEEAGEGRMCSGRRHPTPPCTHQAYAPPATPTNTINHIDLSHPNHK